jgi:protein O-GlcNAc transferase
MKPQEEQQILALIRAGQFTRAKAELMRSIKDVQRSPVLLNALAVVNARLGDLQSSLYYAQAAVKHAPSSAAVWSTLANVQSQLGNILQAAQAYERSLQLDPQDANSWLGRAVLEQQQGEFGKSEEILRKGLSACGTHEVMTHALLNSVADSGRADEALDLAREALEQFSHSPGLRSQACNISISSSRASPQEVWYFHQSFGELLQIGFPPPVVSYLQPRQSKQRLRVGFVSSDLRRHSVACFIDPLFRHADRARCELVAYFNHHQSDAVTQRLRSLVPLWRDVAALSDPELAQQIYKDQIDVLVDLNGHTSGDRLGVFHNKPAPIQLTYLGYPGTTGLASMDGRIVDQITDPPGMTDYFHSEKLIRLDRCFLCFVPPENAPEPSAPEGAICTFGSFNSLHKISDASLQLWSRVLASIPDSKLLIKSPKCGAAEAGSRVLERAVAAGIDPARISIHPPLSDFHAHLNMYGQVDVILDTTPYNGTTTTCEALYMGVPVVTLPGGMHAARVGSSLLQALGHPEWIAETEFDFVRIACELATNLSEMRRDRAAIRRQLLASSLCDQVSYAAAMVEAFHQAWDWWCNPMPSH